MAVLTSVELDEQIEIERCEIRRIKQVISDYQDDLKYHKEKLHGLVAVRKIMKDEGDGSA